MAAPSSLAVQPEGGGHAYLQPKWLNMSLPLYKPCTAQQRRDLRNRSGGVTSTDIGER
jgi:hypothetical protein